jgi:hypothetical protein
MMLRSVPIVPSGVLRFLRLSIAVLGLSGLIACTEDRDFSTETRSVDITYDNALELSSMLLQSAYLAPIHAPLFDLPDREEVALYADAEPLLPGEDGSRVSRFARQCSNGGSIAYRFDVPDTSEFPLQASLEKTFDACDEGLGVTVSGSLDYRYRDFDGLNRAYGRSDTSTCLTALADEIDVAAEIQTLLSQEEAEVLQGNGVKLIRTSGKTLQAYYAGTDTAVVVTRDIETEEFGTETITVEVARVAPDEKAIIVLANEGDQSDRLLTSDGDVLYSVVNGFETPAFCHGYYRQTDAQIRSLTLTWDDFTAALDGSVVLSLQSNDARQVTARIEDSAFSVSVVQAENEFVASFHDASIQKATIPGQPSYTYSFSGDATVSGFGSMRVITALSIIGEQSTRHFRAGSIQVSGSDLQTIIVQPQSDAFTLYVQVAEGGDADGNLQPDLNLLYRISWPDLIDRYFEFATVEDL